MKRSILKFVLPAALLVNMTSAFAVTPHHWVGKWNCSRNGTPTEIFFHLDSFGKVWGLSPNGTGGFNYLYQRPLTPQEGYNRVTEHLLPLYMTPTEHGVQYEPGQVWMLMMHDNFTEASGYTTWAGSMYGLHCFKQ